MGGRRDHVADELGPEPLESDIAASSTPSPAERILGLQRAVGNRAANRVLAKLEVGSADDRYEREADDVANEVVRALRSSTVGASNEAPVGTPSDTKITPAAVRASNPGPPAARRSDTRIRRAAVGPDGGPLPSHTARGIDAARRSGGRPLPGRMREQMGGAFGADFDGVRVHAGSRADALNDSISARAFTLGNDVFFKGGVPDTSSRAGQRLVAHELTHTIQQRRGVARIQRENGDNEPKKKKKKKKKEKNQQQQKKMPSPTRIIAMAMTNMIIVEYKAELAATVAKGLGVGGAHFWQKDVKGFRERMKEAARKVARKDIRAALRDPETFGGVEMGPATRKYMKVEAYAGAYKDAKVLVDDALKRQAEKWADDNFNPNGSWFDAIVPVAEKAAVGSYDPDDHAAALEAADKAAAKALKPRYLALRDAAKAWTANVTGGQGAARFGASTAATMEELIKEEAKEKEVGQKALKEAIEAESMAAGIGKLGKTLDKAIAKPGQSVLFNIEFTIPLDPYGLTSLTLGFEGKAGRGIQGFTTAGVTQLGDEKRLELMGKFHGTLAVQALGLQVGTTVGFFVRAGANSTKDAMSSLSYGSYRAAAAMSDAFGNWWGGQKTGGSLTPIQKAEMWAAAIEESVFKGSKGSAFADVGASADIAAKVTLAVIGIEASMGMESFTRYDEEAIRENLGKLFAKKGAKKATKRRKEAGGGAMMSFNANASFSFKILGQGVETAIGASAEMKDKLGDLWDNFGFEISMTVPFGPADMETAARIASGIVTGIGNAAEHLHTIIIKKDPAASLDVVSDTANIVNAGLDNAITDTLGELYEVPGSPSDVPLGGKASDVEPTAGIDTSGGLQVAFTAGRSGGEWVWRVELRETKTLEVKFGVGSVKFEKQKRLAALGMDDDKKWHAELIGIRKKWD